MVLRPEKEAEAEAIFRNGGSTSRSSATTTDDLRFRVLHQGEEVANLPIKDLGDKAPEYDRPWVEPKKRAPLAADDIPQADVADALLKMLGGPDLSSRRWVWEQYDTLIQGNSLQLPGGDAGVVRVDGHPTKALAFSSDVTPRYCEADPYRRRQAGGRRMLAQPDRDRRRPARRHRQSQFRQSRAPRDHGPVGDGRSKASAKPAARSTSRSSRATSRSTTRPTAAASCRRPTIGGVGLIDDWSKMARIGFAARRRGHPAGRRAAGMGHASRPVDLSCATSTAAPTARRRRSTWRMRSASATSCAS